MKLALEVKSSPSPLPQKPTVGGIDVVSMEKTWHSGMQLVYEKGKILLSIPNNLLWEQQYLMLSHSLQEDSLLNLFLVTVQYWI